MKISDKYGPPSHCLLYEVKALVTLGRVCGLPGVNWGSKFRKLRISGFPAPKVWDLAYRFKRVVSRFRVEGLNGWFCDWVFVN